MAQYSSNITPNAEDDIIAIHHYIDAVLGSPKTALGMVETIYTSLKELSAMPHRCSLVDDERLAAMGYRKLVVKNYIAFFTIDDVNKSVIIERILYARRDWLNIL